jgi:hypothetical protein
VPTDRAMGKAIDEILGNGLGTQMMRIFDTMEWGEDEVARAMKDHPEYADRLYHSFSILTPSNHLLQVELPYRSHCRELLERVMTGLPLATATAAEMASVMSELSYRAPLTTEAMTVYMRVFRRAFPKEGAAMFDSEIGAYEQVSKGRADSIEKQLAKRLYQADRVLKVPVCEGKHWGEYAPSCPFLAVAS